MPTPKTTKGKDRRVAFEVPEEIDADYNKIAEKLRTSKGGLGAISALFVIPKLKSGELVYLNGEIIPNPHPPKAAA
jgi:hypothetical protein